jgi:protein tyrosine phosphatase
MVVQDQVKLIVMLTACKELGKQKCDLYWPCEVGDSLEFDDFTVNLVSVESIMPNLIKRKLMIGDDQIVTHL